MRRIAIALILFQLIGCTKQPAVFTEQKTKEGEKPTQEETPTPIPSPSPTSLSHRIPEPKDLGWKGMIMRMVLPDWQSQRE